MRETLGIIGGSGLYDLPGITNVEELTVKTPYGSTSGPIISGRIGESAVAFLPRHGKGHRLNPSEVPYRANIHALKQLGVTHLLSISAVGSLQEDLPPGTMVLPDQLIDRTVARDRTFFEGGIVAHASLADPFCADLQRHVLATVDQADARAHHGGAYVCIEGPQFSTRAESNLYRRWPAHVIGMTAMPEARLAREAGLCYCIVATVTDYDVWHESEEDVSVASVLAVLAANVDRSKNLIANLADSPLPSCSSGCAKAAAHAVSTGQDSLSDEHTALLSFLTSRNAQSES